MGKKNLEWTEGPKQALAIAIHLNDKYAINSTCAQVFLSFLRLNGLYMVQFTIRYSLDGRDPNWVTLDVSGRFAAFAIWVGKKERCLGKSGT